MQQTELYKTDFTAWFVLQSMRVASQLPEGKWIPAEARNLYHQFSRAAARQGRFYAFIQQLPLWWTQQIIHMCTSRERVRHCALRKYEIQQRAYAQLREGKCRQVVVLGAGLDVLSIQLAAQFPEVFVIELDLPPVQQFKRQVLQEANLGKMANLEFVSGDLTSSLKTILGSCSRFNPDLPTLWIAEGLLMFLPEAAVISLFKDIRGLSAKSSSVIFTTISAFYNGNGFAQRMQKYFLSAYHNLFRWSVNPQQVTELLSSMGYQQVEQITYSQLHQLSKPQAGEDLHYFQTI